MHNGSSTRAVFNQTPPLTDYNLFSSDSALQEAVRREGAGEAAAELDRAGAVLGTAENFEHARLANRHTPVLHTFNARGERIDAIEFHPSWHALMQGIASRGYHSSPWTTPGAAAAGAHRPRNAGQLDLGRFGQHHVSRRTARLWQIDGHARSGVGGIVGGVRAESEFRRCVRALRRHDGRSRGR
jgi:hypothetical protein